MPTLFASVGILFPLRSVVLGRVSTGLAERSLLGRMAVAAVRVRSAGAPDRRSARGSTGGRRNGGSRKGTRGNEGGGSGEPCSGHQSKGEPRSGKRRTVANSERVGSIAVGRDAPGGRVGGVAVGVCGVGDARTGKSGMGGWGSVAVGSVRVGAAPLASIAARSRPIEERPSPNRRSWCDGSDWGVNYREASQSHGRVRPFAPWSASVGRPPPRCDQAERNPRDTRALLSARDAKRPT